MPAIAVWLPARIDAHHRWLPALAVASNIDPRPVRRQRIVKSRVRWFDCRLLWCIIRNVIGLWRWFSGDTVWTWVCRFGVGHEGWPCCIHGALHHHVIMLQ